MKPIKKSISFIILILTIIQAKGQDGWMAGNTMLYFNRHDEVWAEAVVNGKRFKYDMITSKQLDSTEKLSWRYCGEADTFYFNGVLNVFGEKNKIYVRIPYQGRHIFWEDYSDSALPIIKKHIARKRRYRWVWKGDNGSICNKDVNMLSRHGYLHFLCKKVYFRR